MILEFFLGFLNNPIIFILLIIILVYLLLSRGKPTLEGHWNTMIDNFSYSTHEFYEQLTTELQSHGINDLRIMTVQLSTGNIFSGKRLYLRVKWKDYTYDCCCALYGNGTFVSWWLLKNRFGLESLLASIPLIGTYLAQLFYPITYYKIDTGSMFMTYAQNSVLSVIDNITKDQGVRSLTEAERKPILRDVFKR